ncbi:MAG: adenosylmethionine decarboxylase [Thermoanaerobaculia bacterium]
MKTVGQHLIAEYYGCDPSVLDDADRIRAHLEAAAAAVGATVVGEASHRFSPRGVTAVVLIAESHLSIHTWPSRGYAAVDVFTCGGLDPRPACDYLGEALGAETTRFQVIVRGLPEELDEDAPLLPRDVLVVTRMGRVREIKGSGSK